MSESAEGAAQGAGEAAPKPGPQAAPEAVPSLAQRVARAPYVLIRSAHILWLMAVIPLAVVSISQQLHGLGGLLLGILFFSGMVWTMMFMFFDLLTYPTSTLGAIGASSTVFANCYFAWR